MNFLKKPWVLGGLIGLLAAIIINFLGVMVDVIMSNKSFFESLSKGFTPSLLFSLGALGILLGFFIGSRRRKVISRSQNVIKRSALIGGLFGFVFDLYFFSGAPDPPAAISSVILFLPILVGLGVLVGAVLGYGIVKALEFMSQ